MKYIFLFFITIFLKNSYGQGNNEIIGTASYITSSRKNFENQKWIFNINRYTFVPSMFDGKIKNKIELNYTSSSFEKSSTTLSNGPTHQIVIYEYGDFIEIEVKYFMVSGDDAHFYEKNAEVLKNNIKKNVAGKYSITIEKSTEEFSMTLELKKENEIFTQITSVIMDHGIIDNNHWKIKFNIPPSIKPFVQDQKIVVQSKDEVEDPKEKEDYINRLHKDNIATHLHGHSTITATPIKFNGAKKEEVEVTSANKVAAIKVTISLKNIKDLPEKNITLFAKIISPNGKLINSIKDSSGVFYDGKVVVKLNVGDNIVNVYCPNLNGMIAGFYLVDVDYEERCFTQTHFTLK